MKVLPIFLFPLLLFSCQEQVKDGCPEIACTMEFRTITVKIKDAAGTPLIVNNFQAILKRTGKDLQNGALDTTYFKGDYAVATDRETKSLIEKGDTIIVSAINPKTQQRKEANFVVSGGKCACHVQKLSGPEEMVFD